MPLGSAANDVWSVGDDGIATHWNGTAWSSAASGTPNNLLAVWGSGTIAWAVGDRGDILRWNGTAFAAATTGSTKTLHGAWGSGQNDIWVVGRVEPWAERDLGRRRRRHNSSRAVMKRSNGLSA